MRKRDFARFEFHMNFGRMYCIAIASWDPFYWYGLALIPACISNHIHYTVWDEIIYPFPNFNVQLLKGRVRIRKSKSGEKWYEEFVNDGYGISLYRCCTSKLCSCKCQILHHGCALKRERWVSSVFLAKLVHFEDFKLILHYQRTPALVILFQHINKYGNLSW